MRTAQVDLEDLLDLVNCAEDYGHGNCEVFAALADWAGDVSDEEITEFADGFLSEENRKAGYGEEDWDVAIARLTEWRDRYVAPRVEKKG